MMVLAAAATGLVSAAPKRRFNMEGMLREMAPIARRQATNTTVEMIGDLKTQGATTLSGTTIQNCLLGTGPCQDLSTKVIQMLGIYGQGSNKTRHIFLQESWAVTPAKQTHAVYGTLLPLISSNFSLV